MPTAARSPQPHLESPDPDDALGAQESQVVATAPVEGRPSPEQIAREAYLIYLANGRQDGRHEDDWYEAERRLGSSSGVGSRVPLLSRRLLNWTTSIPGTAHRAKASSSTPGRPWLVRLERGVHVCLFH